MKTIHHATLSFGFCLLGATSLCGAAFDSGSTGAHGAFNPTTGTNLQLPPDGIFHFTTVTIPIGVVVTFTRNELNTPVYLLAQSNVLINGIIRVDGISSGVGTLGRGGPGGFNGGFGVIQGFPAGDGLGPGAGTLAGYRSGVFASPKGQNTNVYGNTLLVPLIGGSGGTGEPSNTTGGGGGGGAILIASNLRITSYGNIEANGGNCGNGNAQGGAGSGGAVRLVAPIVDGNGRISAYGGSAQIVGAHAGPGRVRIDTPDRIAWRSLILSANGEKWTVGGQMYVFPPNNPRLDIVEAAGQVIAAGITNAVLIALPALTPTNQTVRVQATGFTTNVPVTVAVVPEAGPSARYDGEIAVSSTNATIGTINVIIPAGSFCNISVWTR